MTDSPQHRMDGLPEGASGVHQAGNAALGIGQDRPLSRRTVAAGLVGAAAATIHPAPVLAATRSKTVVLPFANGERSLVRYPQKRPLILQTSRPPQLETPMAVFDEGLLTPNDAFFVRYHLNGLPTELDAQTYRLGVGGLVTHELSLSLARLQHDFAAVELVAVNQCSGNSRGFVEPRVAGGQLGNGAMGNARWRGVPLRAVLECAGIKQGALQVVFGGLDQPPTDTIPDFAKALDLDHVMRGEVMLAWAMNGQALPFLNGYPLRLVVPGYYGTYWVKHLSRITVIGKEFDGYWMAKAYRIPDTDCGCVMPGTKPEHTRPIGKLNVRSFLTSHADGALVRAGAPVPVRGIAFDGGSGIAKVEVTLDSGATWQPTRLGPDLGRYSFRGWQSELRLPAGVHKLGVRATNVAGETQPLTPAWNPSGYRRNVVETIALEARA